MLHDLHGLLFVSHLAYLLDILRDHPQEALRRVVHFHQLLPLSLLEYLLGHTKFYFRGFRRSSHEQGPIICQLLDFLLLPCCCIAELLFEERVQRCR